MGQGKIGFGPWGVVPPPLRLAGDVDPAPGAVIRAALRCAWDGVYEGEFAAPEGAAVRHPHGYAKIPVALVPDTGQRLFLLAWFRDLEDADIHNHRWDFASTVLTGALHHTVVKFGPPGTGDGPGYQQALHRSIVGGFILTGVPASVQRPTFVRTETLPPGSEYALPDRALHRVGAQRGTMTLVARGPRRRSLSDVCLDRPVDESPQRMRAVAPDERERWLRAALDAAR